MSKLIGIELSISSIGGVISKAYLSNSINPIYFSTSNVDRICDSLRKKRIVVPEKFSVTRTPEFNKHAGISMQLVQSNPG